MCLLSELRDRRNEFLPPDFSQLEKVLVINRHQRAIAEEFLRVRVERPDDGSPVEISSIWIVVGELIVRLAPDVPSDKVALACWQLAKTLIAIRGLSIAF